MRLLATALVAMLLAPAAARAWVRTTVDTQPDLPVWWAPRRQEVFLASGSSLDVGPADLVLATDASLAAWTRPVACTDLELVPGGEAGGLGTNLMGGAHDGQNRIVFREGAWPADLGPDTIAITSLVYRRSSGELLDGDIDVNAVDHAWSAGPVPGAGTYDVQNTLTHELGHLIGLGHSTVSTATMFVRTDPEETLKRDLDADDLDALCYVYPAGMRTPGGVGPRAPLGSGCAAGRSPRGGAAPTLAVLAWLGVRAARARRRRPSPVR